MKTIIIADYVQTQLDNLSVVGPGARVVAQMAAIVLCEIAAEGDVLVKASNADVAELTGRIEQSFTQWKKDQRKRK